MKTDEETLAEDERQLNTDIDRLTLYPELVEALKSLNTAAIEFQVYRDLVGGCIGEQVQAVLAKAEALKEE